MRSQVGIGVDDIVVLVDAMDRTDPLRPMDERLGEAMRHAGSAVFLTSFTNLVAFIVRTS